MYRLEHSTIFIYIPLGKIRHRNVIRRHDETRRRNDLGNWLYMKVFRTSFYVATFSRRCDNVVYVAMSSQRFCDVGDVKIRPENFHIQPNIHVLLTLGFNGRRLAEWDNATILITLFRFLWYMEWTMCNLYKKSAAEAVFRWDILKRIDFIFLKVMLIVSFFKYSSMK